MQQLTFFELLALADRPPAPLHLVGRKVRSGPPVQAKEKWEISVITGLDYYNDCWLVCIQDLRYPHMQPRSLVEHEGLSWELIDD